MSALFTFNVRVLNPNGWTEFQMDARHVFDVYDVMFDQHPNCIRVVAKPIGMVQQELSL